MSADPTMQPEPELGFEWPNADMTWTLHPGETTAFSVLFMPVRAGRATTTMILGHTGANASQVVSLAGNGVGGGLVISENARDGLLEFGDVGVGERREETLRLTNATVDPAPMNVRMALTTGTTAFSLRPHPSAELGAELDMMLEVDASVDVSVALSPTASGPIVGELEVVASEVGTTRVALRESGAVGPEISLDPSTVDFGAVRPGRRSIDRALPVENRGNAVRGIDPPTPAVISPAVLARDDALTSSLSAAEVGGVGLVHAITATRLALTEPELSRDNHALLRSEADLSLVYLSTDEASHGDLGPAIDFVLGLKGPRSRRLRVNAIVNTEPGDGQPCSSETGSGRYAPHFIGMTEATGGLAVPICGDYREGVDRLAPFTYGRTRRFRLSGLPRAGTMNVTVDAVGRDGAWSYREEDRSVVFTEEAAPSFGSVVEVTYATEWVRE